ncbi:MAG TPA: TIGR02556 family CRISPR-associated protein [Thermotoga sp.]|uniref:TIGR02556 family CRISPR-associated protein n=1 Tax=Thermotoga sp. (strain RQ2) TaxID=126740 RepID=UPI0001601732|nr:TIGR02556 family CRISPR-associated protein [Thermotoga sp. RQ2]ACB09368.1 CRISPR-associated protein, TM1802 family [Thermotoga sp. RQ2]HBF70005.1 TIGR02556 family CRISPR-associated protein [Thermotoga sp.]
MLEKIYNLGKIGIESLSDFAEELPLEDGLAIFLESGPNGLIFKDIGPVKKSPGGKSSKVFLYRKQRGNFSSSVSPTMKFLDESSVSRDPLERTFDVFLGFFDHPKISHIKDVLERNKEKIIEKLRNYDLKNRFLTISIDGKFPAEVPEILRAFEDKVTQKKTKGEAKCFLCGKEANSRLSDVFKFATFDKPGFTPFLSRKHPIQICGECRSVLEKARRVIDEKLSFSFFNNRILWIIPSVPNQDILESVIEKISEIKDTDKKSKLRSFARLERKIEDVLSENEKAVYDFILIEKEQQAERIVLHIEEVSPTRVRQILDESDKTESQLKEDGFEISVNFSVIHKFFEDLDRYFNSLFSAVFSEGTFDKKLLLTLFLSKIRSDFFGNDTLLSAREAFATYVYLRRLNVLKGGASVLKGEDFFSRYPEFFDEPWKKAVFLEGVLANYLLYLQYVKRNSKAFTKKLKGLRLTKRDVEGLLPEIRAKIEAYGGMSESVAELFREATEAFLEAGNWSASPDEISFVFVSGLSLGKTFFKEVEVDESGEKQE